MNAVLDRRFALTKRGSSLRTEVVGGITSFLAAAYLLVVIPSLLAGRFRDVPMGLVVLAIPLGYYFWTVVGGKH